MTFNLKIINKKSISSWDVNLVVHVSQVHELTKRYKRRKENVWCVYLTIIPPARMGSESIAHEAEGRMGYWLRGHEGERNNCFSKIQLVGKKYRE